MPKQTVLIALFGLLVSFKLLAFNLPANDFTARYEAGKYSTIVAEMTLSLTRDGDKVSYLSKTKARGLLALISNDKITESSHLLCTESDMLQLQSYRYKRKKKPQDNQQYQLEWQNDSIVNIRGKYNKKDISLKDKQAVWDNLSVQLALMSDVSGDAVFNTKYNYTVVHKGQLKHYQFELLSRQTLNINGKSYQTLKVKRQHGSSGKRNTYFWLATELDNLPIKIEQHKNNELSLSIKMIEYKKKTAHD